MRPPEDTADRLRHTKFQRPSVGATWRGCLGIYADRSRAEAKRKFGTHAYTQIGQGRMRPCCGGMHGCSRRGLTPARMHQLATAAVPTYFGSATAMRRHHSKGVAATICHSLSDSALHCPHAPSDTAPKPHIRAGVTLGQVADGPRYAYELHRADLPRCPVLSIRIRGFGPMTNSSSDTKISPTSYPSST